MAKGLFITFEGGDGVGKTTQIDRLAAWFEARGREVVRTREPGGTELGVAIRQALLHGGEVTPRAEALLYAADRAQHVDMVVRPALERGAIVLGDRYLDSSVAYQGVARALGKDEVRGLSLWAVQGLLPDLTILLDLPVEIGESRVGPVQDRLEAAGREFHEAVRAEFLALAGQEPERWRVVDASGTIGEVAAAVQQAVVERLDRVDAGEALGQTGAGEAGAHGPAGEAEPGA